MSKAWMIRAGRDSVYVEDFLEEGVVAIGWEELGPIDDSASKEEILKQYDSVHPGHSKGKAQASVSQILRFLHEVDREDRVVTYDRDRRLYLLGEITSDPIWDPDTIVSKPRIRKVKWTHRVPRDSLSTSTKNTLGAIQTLFQINAEATNEIYEKAVSLDQPEEIDATVAAQSTDASDSHSEVQVSEGLLETIEQSIEERIVRLDWENVQLLVAGILRGMGYRASVTPRGADRGVDVFASPDGLGLEDSRIFVEVKHRQNTRIGSSEIRSFLGGRSQGDKCLYVSTGGFTKDAKYEADRANVPVQLIGLTRLRQLLVENYDHLDETTRSLVPLQRVYVLAEQS